MVKYQFGQEIPADSGYSIKKAKERHIQNTRRKMAPKPFRVYIVNKSDYTAKGYWIDGGKLYSYRTASKKEALRYVKTLSERNGGATVELKGGLYKISSYK